MSDLQPVDALVLDVRPLTVALEPVVSSARVNAAMVRQIVLRLADGVEVQRSLTRTPGTDLTADLPADLTADLTTRNEVVAAVQQLMAVMGSLRSPDSGFPLELLEDSEAIAPYVIEEAWDVVEAVRRRSPQTASPDAPTVPAVSLLGDEAAVIEPEYGPMLGPVLGQEYALIETLEPWLLWCIARSTYETMRLLEGVAAQVQSAEGWQAGVVRLVMALTVETEEALWSLDLVTHQPPPELLGEAVIVQTPDYEFGRQPTSAEQVVQQVMGHSRTTTPAVGQFFDGITVDALLPERGWQIAQVRIQLGLQFIADAVDTGINQAIAPDLVVPSADEGLKTPTLAPMVTFTDEAWIERYQQAIAQHYLADQIPCLASIRAIGTLAQDDQGRDDEPVNPDLILPLIAEVSPLAAALPMALAQSGRNLPRHELGLDDLTLRLLWCFNRSADGVMQLMGGIKARSLRPGHGWEWGTLRLRVSLTVQTPEMDWQLDLVTGQPIYTAISLADDGIVQSPESAWCEHPLQVRQLRQRVLQALRHSTPELENLMEPTSIDLLGAEHEWQPGVMQMHVDVAFVGDSRWDGTGVSQRRGETLLRG